MAQKFDKTQNPASRKTAVSSSCIDWQYFSEEMADAVLTDTTKPQ